MIIEKMEIYKILNCNKHTLIFDDVRRSSIFVVRNTNDCKTHHLFTLAVQLLCSAKYARNICEDPMFKSLCEGFVRMKFTIPVVPDHLTSSDAGNKDISIDCDRAEDAIEAEEREIGGNDHGEHGTQQHQGNIEMDLDLLPSTSKEAQRRLQDYQRGHTKPTQRRYLSNTEPLKQKSILINVCRDFRTHPDEVTYSINNGPEERCNVPKFHGRFHICLDYTLPFLKNISEFNGDWLELLTSDLNEKWNRRMQLDDPFEKFVSLYHKYGYPKQHILSKVARANISTADAVETLQKTYAIKILRDTRGIFEYISGEYTVLFYTPHYGRHLDVVSDLRVEELNFEFMTTFIQDNSSLTHRKFLWTDALPALKDMLLVAFQISLSFHCKQRLIYLNNFDEISGYQASVMATTAFFQKIGVGRIPWTSKNYLQRIVDVCINIGTTSIIEYPGSTPLHPVNAYFMKSYQTEEGDNSRVSLKILKNHKYSFEYFLECFEGYLKSSQN